MRFFKRFCCKVVFIFYLSIYTASITVICSDYRPLRYEIAHTTALIRIFYIRTIWLFVIWKNRCKFSEEKFEVIFSQVTQYYMVVLQAIKMLLDFNFHERTESEYSRLNCAQWYKILYPTILIFLTIHYDHMALCHLRKIDVQLFSRKIRRQFPQSTQCFIDIQLLSITGR